MSMGFKFNQFYIRERIYKHIMERDNTSSNNFLCAFEDADKRGYIFTWRMVGSATGKQLFDRGHDIADYYRGLLSRLVRNVLMRGS
jgi:hypothetical protein